MPMESASVIIKSRPVIIIAWLLTWALATPDNRPTVEAKLSSTPKVKLRMEEGSMFN